MGAGFHFKRPRRLLGLDFGASSFKVVELTRIGAEVRLTGFDASPVGDDPERAQPILWEERPEMRSSNP